jgi:3',5'-cyclic AMP phosphodiesterase CpdA
MQMKRKTFLALAASAMLAVLAGVTTSCTDVNDNPVGNPDAPNAAADAPAFDENNVVLAFVGMSDIHIMEDPKTSMDGIRAQILAQGLTPEDLGVDMQKLLSTSFKNNESFQNAFPFLAAKSPRGLDALAIPGDLTNNGLQAEIDTLVKYFTAEPTIKDKPFIFASGNHDLFNENESKFTQRMKASLPATAYAADIKPFGANDSRHTVVNGIHFIQINVDNYEWSKGVYLAPTLQWLEAEMEEASKADPTKPIFVLSHLAISNTVTGSDYTSPNVPDMVWACDYIKPILDKYPQAFLLSGHTHYSMNNERDIMQDRFTMMNIGPLHYLISDNDFYNLGNGAAQLIDDYARHPQAVLFEVDKNGTTRVRCYDCGLGEQIGQSLIVNAPGYRNSLTSYGYDRSLKPGPTFPASDSIKVTMADKKKPILTFQRANGNGSQVYYYLVTISDSTGVGNHIYRKYQSDIYSVAQESEMAETVVINLGTLPLSAGKYFVTVTACNVWNKFGDTLTAMIELKDE